MIKQTTITTTTTMKRMTVLLALMMAALVALSTLAASDAEAKKRKKPSLTPVQCQTSGSCNGSAANDLYAFPDPFDVVTLDDPGGTLDVVNLSKFERAQVQVHRGSGSEGDILFASVDGPGRSIIIKDFYASDSGPDSSFGSGKIEYFMFKDGIVKAEQLGV